MIIQSLLDTDFYKFTMGKIVFSSFPFDVKYEFKCRNTNIVWSVKMLTEINDELQYLCSLKFAKNEIDYLRRFSYFDDAYLSFLSRFQLKMSQCNVYLSEDKELKIEINGSWIETIFFEIPILSIVNEVYFRNTTKFEEIIESGIKRLVTKIEIAEKHKFKFLEFGTRRRYSFDWQNFVIQELGQRLPKSIFGGTSNAYFAFKHGNDLSGTMAHELIQAGQSIDNVELKNSQKYMLEKWLLEFNGKLSIALTDTLGLDKFLRDFDFNLSSSYAGVRHDSGDPIEWAYKMIKHYDDFNISSIDKTFVFSDGLDFNKIININNLFKDKANLMFGVGTNLTNDFEEVTPLQIVIKMIGCNGKLVAKLSDNPIKTMCKDNNYLNILKDAIKE